MSRSGHSDSAGKMSAPNGDSPERKPLAAGDVAGFPRPTVGGARGRFSIAVPRTIGGRGRASRSRLGSGTSGARRRWGSDGRSISPARSRSLGSSTVGGCPRGGRCASRSGAAGGLPAGGPSLRRAEADRRASAPAARRLLEQRGVLEARARRLGHRHSSSVRSPDRRAPRDRPEETGRVRPGRAGRTSASASPIRFHVGPTARPPVPGTADPSVPWAHARGEKGRRDRVPDALRPLGLGRGEAGRAKFAIAGYGWEAGRDRTARFARDRGAGGSSGCSERDSRSERRSGAPPYSGLAPPSRFPGSQSRPVGLGPVRGGARGVSGSPAGGSSSNHRLTGRDRARLRRLGVAAQGSSPWSLNPSPNPRGGSERSRRPSDGQVRALAFPTTLAITITLRFPFPWPFPRSDAADRSTASAASRGSVGSPGRRSSRPRCGSRSRRGSPLLPTFPLPLPLPRPWPPASSSVACRRG